MKQQRLFAEEEEARKKAQKDPKKEPKKEKEPP
jgi:hypothetical protein